MGVMTNGEARGIKTPPSEETGAERETIYAASDIAYLELSMKRLTEELKEKGCLRQDFRFLTKEERNASLERCVDQFLSHP